MELSAQITEGSKGRGGFGLAFLQWLRWHENLGFFPPLFSFSQYHYHFKLVIPEISICLPITVTGMFFLSSCPLGRKTVSLNCSLERKGKSLSRSHQQTSFCLMAQILLCIPISEPIMKLENDFTNWLWWTRTCLWCSRWSIPTQLTFFKGHLDTVTMKALEAKVCSRLQ